MADTPVAFDALEPLQIQSQLPAKVAFNDVFAFLNRVNDLRQLLLVQILRANRRINARLLQDDLRIAGADAINVAQSDVDSLFAWNFYAYNSCQKK